MQLGVGGRAIVPEAAHGACPGDTGDHAAADTFRTLLLKKSAIKKPPSAVAATPEGPVELGVGGRAIVPEVPAVPVPATRVITPPADTFRTLLLEKSAIKKPPSAVAATPVGLVELGVGGRAIVAGAARGTGSGDAGDHPIRRHLPHHVVAGVGDQEPAVGGHRHPDRAVELGVGGRAVVAAARRYRFRRRG